MKITPLQLQHAAKRGFDRIQTYRRARAMFIRAYVGQYYEQRYGVSGDAPFNLIFNAVRIMVPNLVMLNPRVDITTDILEQKDYAELLSLGINRVFKDTEIKEPLRTWIVDALFGFGIMKTAMSDNNTQVFVDDEYIDVGQIYNRVVDLDNFTFDPFCSNPLFRGAMFTGHSVVIPRDILLNAKGFNKDRVKELPSIASDVDKNDRVSKISDQYKYGQEFAEHRDMVRIVELWVPNANAMITIPDPRVTMFDDYLRMVEYYGPDEGPYTYLSFTPPVPNNPFPVAPIGIWYDLHEAANKICRKVLDQAERQKDITLVNPAQTDTAADVRDAEDGEIIVTSDPNGIKVVSYGGVNSDNENMLYSLQSWFSYMAGNVDQVGGAKSQARTATQASILEANSTVTIEDSKTIIQDEVSLLARKTGWYLHTDPLIDIPLTRRSGGQAEQLRLTPEQRQGDFLTLLFDTVARSFVRMNPQVKSTRIMEFAVNVVPAAVQASLMCTQQGIPFNLQKFLTKIAEELDMLDWVTDIFDDPQFLQKLQVMFMNGPQNAGKAESGIIQNKGYSQKRDIKEPQQVSNKAAQEYEAPVQAANQGVY